MKILLDMNLSPNWVGFLAAAGIEAVHWSSVGSGSATDATIMDWARRNSFTVFTHDLDFSALLAATRERGPSVIQIRTTDTLPEAIGNDVVRVLRLRAAALDAGAIITIDKHGARIRELPIARAGRPTNDQR